MPLRLAIHAGARGALPAAMVARLGRRASRMVVAAALHDVALGAPARVEVGLTLTGDDEMALLNGHYRRRRGPTDVLAFAMREGPGGELHRHLLGDVVVSVETARRQARRGLYREVLHLWAHGFCHLLGYDHPTARAEAEMNTRMRALLAEAERRGPVRAA